MSDESTGEVILYERDGAPAIQVQLVDETVWLSQQQLAALFQTSRTNVLEHIANIYEERELNEAATCREFRQVRLEVDRLMLAMEARTLDGGGSVSSKDATSKAEQEYAKYRSQLAAELSEVEVAYLETVKCLQRKVEGKKPK